MSTLATTKLRDLRLGNVIEIDSDRVGRVYSLEVTGRGEIRVGYYYGTGDNVRTDCWIDGPDETLLTHDESVSLADRGDVLYHGNAS